MVKTFKDEKETKNAVEAKFKELTEALHDACPDLHKSEGLVEVNTTIDIQMKPAGQSGCQ